jgi:prefoldin subunit 5
LQDGKDHLDDLLNGGSGVLANIGGKDSGSAKLEGGGEVTVDVGDGTTVETMSVVASRLEKRVFVQEETIKRLNQ